MFHQVDIFFSNGLRQHSKNNESTALKCHCLLQGLVQGLPHCFLNNNTLAEDLQRTARTVNAACQRMEVQDLSKNRGGHIQSAPWKQIITLFFRLLSSSRASGE